MELSRTIETETGEMIVKRVSVPLGLEELMEGLAKEVILKKPKDIYIFAAEYFSRLLQLRDSGLYRGNVRSAKLAVRRPFRATVVGHNVLSNSESRGSPNIRGNKTPFQHKPDNDLEDIHEAKRVMIKSHLRQKHGIKTQMNQSTAQTIKQPQIQSKLPSRSRSLSKSSDKSEDKSDKDETIKRISRRSSAEKENTQEKQPKRKISPRSRSSSISSSSSSKELKDRKRMGIIKEKNSDTCSTDNVNKKKYGIEVSPENVESIDKSGSRIIQRSLSVTQDKNGHYEVLYRPTPLPIGEKESSEQSEVEGKKSPNHEEIVSEQIMNSMKQSDVRNTIDEVRSAIAIQALWRGRRDRQKLKESSEEASKVVSNDSKLEKSPISPENRAEMQENTERNHSHSLQNSIKNFDDTQKYVNNNEIESFQEKFDGINDELDPSKKENETDDPAIDEVDESHKSNVRYGSPDLASNDNIDETDAENEDEQNIRKHYHRSQTIEVCNKTPNLEDTPEQSNIVGQEGDVNSPVHQEEDSSTSSERNVDDILPEKSISNESNTKSEETFKHEKSSGVSNQEIDNDTRENIVVPMIQDEDSKSTDPKGKEDSLKNEKNNVEEHITSHSVENNSPSTEDNNKPIHNFDTNKSDAHEALIENPTEGIKESTNNQDHNEKHDFDETENNGDSADDNMFPTHELRRKRSISSTHDPDVTVEKISSIENDSEQVEKINDNSSISARVLEENIYSNEKENGTDNKKSDGNDETENNKVENKEIFDDSVAKIHNTTNNSESIKVEQADENPGSGVRYILVNDQSAVDPKIGNTNVEDALDTENIEKENDIQNEQINREENEALIDTNVSVDKTELSSGNEKNDETARMSCNGLEQNSPTDKFDDTPLFGNDNVDEKIKENNSDIENNESHTEIPNIEGKKGGNISAARDEKNHENMEINFSTNKEEEPKINEIVSDDKENGSFTDKPDNKEIDCNIRKENSNENSENTENNKKAKVNSAIKPVNMSEYRIDLENVEKDSQIEEDTMKKHIPSLERVIKNDEDIGENKNEIENGKKTIEEINKSLEESMEDIKANQKEIITNDSSTNVQNNLDSPDIDEDIEIKNSSSELNPETLKKSSSNIELEAEHDISCTETKIKKLGSAQTISDSINHANGEHNADEQQAAGDKAANINENDVIENTDVINQDNKINESKQTSAVEENTQEAAIKKVNNTENKKVVSETPNDKSISSEKEYAIRIQTIWRGYQARKQLKQLLEHKIKNEDQHIPLVKKLSEDSVKDENENSSEIKNKNLGSDKKNLNTKENFVTGAIEVYNEDSKENSMSLLDSQQNECSNTDEIEAAKKIQSVFRRSRKARSRNVSDYNPDEKKVSITDQEEKQNDEIFEVEPIIKSKKLEDLNATESETKEDSDDHKQKTNNHDELDAALKIQKAFRNSRKKPTRTGQEASTVSEDSMNASEGSQRMGVKKVIVNKTENVVESESSKVSDSKKSFSPDEVEAAKKIQSTFRQSRKKRMKPTLEDLDLDSDMGKKYLKEILQIQSAWRAYKVRKNIRDVEKKISSMENISGTDSKKSIHLTDQEILKAVTKIQAGLRGYLTRKHFNNIRERNEALDRIKEESYSDYSRMSSTSSTDEQLLEILKQVDKAKIPNTVPEIHSDENSDDLKSKITDKVPIQNGEQEELHSDTLQNDSTSTTVVGQPVDDPKSSHVNDAPTEVDDQHNEEISSQSVEDSDEKEKGELQLENKTHSDASIDDNISTFEDIRKDSIKSEYNTVDESDSNKIPETPEMKKIIRNKRGLQSPSHEVAGENTVNSEENSIEQKQNPEEKKAICDNTATNLMENNNGSEPNTYEENEVISERESKSEQNCSEKFNSLESEVDHKKSDSSENNTDLKDSEIENINSETDSMKKANLKKSKAIDNLAELAEKLENNEKLENEQRSNSAPISKIDDSKTESEKLASFEIPDDFEAYVPEKRFSVDENIIKNSETSAAKNFDSEKTDSPTNDSGDLNSINSSSEDILKSDDITKHEEENKFNNFSDSLGEVEKTINKHICINTGDGETNCDLSEKSDKLKQKTDKDSLKSEGSMSGEEENTSNSTSNSPREIEENIDKNFCVKTCEGGTNCALTEKWNKLKQDNVDSLGENNLKSKKPTLSDFMKKTLDIEPLQSTENHEVVPAEIGENKLITKEVEDSSLKNRQESAIRIQSLYRGFQARKYFEGLKSSIPSTDPVVLAQNELKVNPSSTTTDSKSVATVKDESSNDKTNKSPRDSTLQETRKHDVAVGSNGNVHSPQSQENVPAGVEILTTETQHPTDVGETSGDVETDAQPSFEDANTQDVLSNKPEVESECEMEPTKRNNSTLRNKNMEAEAATKIQAGFRGYKVRKQLKMKDTSSEGTNKKTLRRKSSSCLSENQAKKQKENIDLQEKSAVKIQAGIRGFLVRKRVKKPQKSHE